MICLPVINLSKQQNERNMITQQLLMEQIQQMLLNKIVLKPMMKETFIRPCFKFKWKCEMIEEFCLVTPKFMGLTVHRFAA